MRRLSTTVLTVVGDEAAACLRWFAGAANVSVIDHEPDEERSDPLDRAQRVWGRTVRSNARFTLHDADPLRKVGRAWIDRFDGATGAEDRGRLEVAVAEVVARWRADAVGLPDYYLVLDPEGLDEASTHWYLGVLHRAAPHRVVPVAADGPAVAAAVGRLGAGRWWPELPTLLADLDRELPDRPMLAATATATDGV